MSEFNDPGRIIWGLLIGILLPYSLLCLSICFAVFMFDVFMFMAYLECIVQ